MAEMFLNFIRKIHRRLLLIDNRLNSNTIFANYKFLTIIYDLDIKKKT